MYDFTLDFHLYEPILTVVGYHYEHYGEKSRKKYTKALQHLATNYSISIQHNALKSKKSVITNHINKCAYEVTNYLANISKYREKIKWIINNRVTGGRSVSNVSMDNSTIVENNASGNNISHSSNVNQAYHTHHHYSSGSDTEYDKGFQTKVISYMEEHKRQTAQVLGILGNLCAKLKVNSDITSDIINMNNNTDNNLRLGANSKVSQKRVTKKRKLNVTTSDSEDESSDSLGADLGLVSSINGIQTVTKPNTLQNEYQWKVSAMEKENNLNTSKVVISDDEDSINTVNGDGIPQGTNQPKNIVSDVSKTPTLKRGRPPILKDRSNVLTPIQPIRSVR